MLDFGLARVAPPLSLDATAERVAYRCAAGELDLIVLDHRVVVFVEVKTRTGHGFGSPFEAVEFRKQRKMIQAAQYFLAEKKLQQRDARFDVVGISWPGRDPMVEHIENAFELS